MTESHHTVHKHLNPGQKLAKLDVKITGRVVHWLQTWFSLSLKVKGEKSGRTGSHWATWSSASAQSWWKSLLTARMLCHQLPVVHLSTLLLMSSIIFWSIIFHVVCVLRTCEAVLVQWPPNLCLIPIQRWPVASLVLRMCSGDVLHCLQFVCWIFLPSLGINMNSFTLHFNSVQFLCCHCKPHKQWHWVATLWCSKNRHKHRTMNHK